MMYYVIYSRDDIGHNIETFTCAETMLTWLDDIQMDQHVNYKVHKIINGYEVLVETTEVAIKHRIKHV